MLNVEHVLTFMTVLGACVAGARVFIPDENLGKTAAEFGTCTLRNEYVKVQYIVLLS